LGLISKETAVIAPFLVLLAEYGVLRHGHPIVRNRLDIVLLSLPAVAALLIVLDIASGAGPLSQTFLPGYEHRDFTLAERLLTQPRVIGFHLSQIFWPLPGRFSLEHDFEVSTGLLTPASTLAALFGVVFWCVLGVWALFRTRWRVVGFFLLWVPATLVIESTIVALEMVFEHRMYLSSVALAGLVAVGLSWVLQRALWLRIGPLTALGAVVLLLALSTSQRVPVWRSGLSLAQDVVKNAPNSARAWSTLANALKEGGHGWEEIAPPMRNALALDPHQPLALHLRALQLLGQGKFDEAEKILERLVHRETVDHSVRNTIGMLRFERGDLPGAIAEFERAITLNPFVPEFRYNLALSYELSGRCREARLKWLSYLQYEGGRCFGYDR
jgi:hypothetical protein